ncbi:MAG: hypothetical protein PHS56_07010 [Eubacteriales bacterium]|nr:hypothetical protein [Eubacteriales bacterium]
MSAARGGCQSAAGRPLAILVFALPAPLAYTEFPGESRDWGRFV